MAAFFNPSDYTIKLRRNLLFLCITYILHTSIQPLTDLKVFSVNIPSELLEYGIPLFILWFTFNYFYGLTAEMLQWRTDSLERENGEYSMVGLTGLMTPTIAELKPEKFVVISNIKGEYQDNKKMDSEITGLEKAFNDWKDQFNNLLQEDLKAIERFELSFKKYHTANKIRYYALDNGIPALMIFSCIVSKIWFSLPN